MITLEQFNRGVAENIHLKSVAVQKLIDGMLEHDPSICACDANGACAAHADGYNELKIVKFHLDKAAQAFLKAHR